MSIADEFRAEDRAGLEAFIAAGLERRRCLWCERELRPCNMRRHVEARHFRQLTIYDVLGPDEPPNAKRAA